METFSDVDLEHYLSLQYDALDGFFRGTENVVRIPRNKLVRFVLSSTHPFTCKDLSFCTNYPVIIDGVEPVAFDRQNFVALSDSHFNGLNNWSVSFFISKAGAFDFYMNYTDESGAKVNTPKYQFVVDAILLVNDYILPLDALSIQTCITKFLGPLSNWDSMFAASAEARYNMIHLTPVQQLGESKSAYSLYHQLHLADGMFDDLSSLKSEAEKVELFAKTLRQIEKDHNILFLCDVVWNHTANNTPWLKEHPEAGYSLENSPHLKPAFALDEALFQFSKACPQELKLITDEAKLQEVMSYIKTHVVYHLKLWEYYVASVESEVEKFKQTVTSFPPGEQHSRQLSSLNKAKIATTFIQNGIFFDDNKGERFPCHLNIPEAVAFLYSKSVDLSNLHEATAFIQDILQICNVDRFKTYDEDLVSILTNIENQAQYERIAPHGPQVKEITDKTPITKRFFTKIVNEKDEFITAVANNGWIWDGNPRVDFASKSSRAYIRREVIVWEDCVKLRYGAGPEDNPWLWEHMSKYTAIVAQLFHGVRIDNAHSTPIHAAQHFLDVARRLRPELFCIAELFTGSAEIDTNFVSRLGLNALIREAMRPGDTKELGRFIHRNSQIPVGSLKSNNFSLRVKSNLITSELPRAAFVDCTHDNETPLQKRTGEDTLSTSGLVAFTHSTIGSTRGYDELVPVTLSVKAEKLYKLYRLPSTTSTTYQGLGIIPVKSKLNSLHVFMEKNGFSETHVHQIDEQLVVITRHDPNTHASYHLVCRTAFPHQHNYAHPVSVTIPGKLFKFVLAAKLAHIDKHHSGDSDSNIIEGTNCELLLSIEHTSLCSIKEVDNASLDISLFAHDTFTRGSILILETCLPDQVFSDVVKLNGLLKAEIPFAGIDLISLNSLLYRCEQEERSATGNGGYDVPGYGALIYCGIAGFFPLLDDLKARDDLGHPIFNNLRAGDWLMEYTAGRLSQCPELEPIQKWLESCFASCKKLPRFLLPKYFDAIITKLYTAANAHAISFMSPFVKKYVTLEDGNNNFILKLAMASVQLCGDIASSPLSCSNRIPGVKRQPSLAAGLPHFSAGYMRNWGRDTFIALKGLLLDTGRLDDAKFIIKGFASCLRHGLIPNLLDSGNRPRYNARDATWFFLQAIQDYCSISPEGLSFLSEKVPIFFPVDNYDEYKAKYESAPISVNYSIAEVIQNIMEKHAKGIEFREWNAGHEIDQVMKSEGFNISIRLDEETGFILGGNDFNCGTWMDKNCESHLAGNFGNPATSRNGAPVEITGLLKSTLCWLGSLEGNPAFPFTGVTCKSSHVLAYKEWENRIKTSFEKHYYIPESKSEDHKYALEQKLVNRRGIYKDVFGSNNAWPDYQFRPNFCIAMAVAPDLFVPAHAKLALKLVEEHLIAPLGVRTLDPSDWAYRPNYEHDDSTDPSTAKGANYHQGPEWVWPRGYFLRAIIEFHKEFFANNSLDRVTKYFNNNLVELRNQILTSPWHGITELTNKDGAVCTASCPSQAWSSACVLDALFELDKLISAQ